MELQKVWTDAKTLYFHFFTENGLSASLPMVRTLQAFEKEFSGVPGTTQLLYHGRKTWIVPGYRCLNCGKTFFSPDRDGLKHACMKNGGVISDRPSMGV